MSAQVSRAPGVPNSVPAGAKCRVQSRIRIGHRKPGEFREPGLAQKRRTGWIV